MTEEIKSQMTFSDWILQYDGHYRKYDGFRGIRSKSQIPYRDEARKHYSQGLTAIESARINREAYVKAEQERKRTARIEADEALRIEREKNPLTPEQLELESMYEQCNAKGLGKIFSEATYRLSQSVTERRRYEELLSQIKSSLNN